MNTEQFNMRETLITPHLVAMEAARLIYNRLPDRPRRRLVKTIRNAREVVALVEPPPYFGDFDEYANRHLKPAAATMTLALAKARRVELPVGPISGVVWAQSIWHKESGWSLLAVHGLDNMVRLSVRYT